MPDFLAAIVDGGGDASDADSAAQELAKQLPTRKFGRGRHGGKLERRAVCTVMREKKWEKRKHDFSRTLGTAVANVWQDRTIFRGRARNKLACQLRRYWGRRRKRHIAAAIEVISKKKGKNSWLASSEMLEMTLGAQANRSIAEVAAVTGISGVWARVVRNSIAACYLNKQGLAMGHLIRLCREHRPALCVSRFAWDETGQKICMGLPSYSAEQQVSTWQVACCIAIIIISILLLYHWRVTILISFYYSK